MKQPVNIYEPQKLSLIAIIISLLNSLRKLWPVLIIPIIQYISLSEKKTKNDELVVYLLFIGLSILVLIQLGTVFEYFTTKFFVNENNEFVYKTGLLNKRTTIIALEKIQSLQSKQSLLNRLSNTFSLKVETAGSEQAEVSLTAISEEQYLLLKNWLQAAEFSSSTIENTNNAVAERLNPKGEVLQLNVKDFLRLCISENHFKTLLIIAAFIFGKLQEVKDFLGLKAEEVIDSGVETVGNTFSNILLVVIFILVLTIFVSAIRLVLKYFNFQVQIGGNKFHMKWGLINTQQKTVTFAKIQMLSYKSNLIRRWLILAILRMYTLGEEDNKHDTQITLPITNTHQTQSITNAYQNNLIFDYTSYINIQKGYIANRLLIVGIPVALLLSIPAFWFEFYTILIPLLWLIYFIITKYIFFKKFKAFVSETCLKVEEGIWGNETFILKWHNIQGITLKTSPFQRKNGLANLVIKTTHAPIILPFIPLAKAHFLYNYALYKMEIESQ